MRFRFILILILIVSLVLSLLNVNSSADASYMVWNNTTQFNYGSLSSADTNKQNSCVPMNQIQANWTNGSTVPFDGCPTGSNRISNSNLTFSYDMQTVTTQNTGSLKSFKDFSSNRNDGQFLGTNSVSGPSFGGGGRYFGINSSVMPSGSFPWVSNSFVVNKFTFSTWLKANSSVSCAPDVCTILASRVAQVSTGYMWFYSFPTGSGTLEFVVQWEDNVGGTHSGAIGYFPQDSIWHQVILTYDFGSGHTASLYIDGTLEGTVTLTNSVGITWVSGQNWVLGNQPNFAGTLTGNEWRGSIGGPTMLWYRLLSSSERGELQTSYLLSTTYSWRSNVHTNASGIPQYVVVDTYNSTFSDGGTVTTIQVLNGSSSVFFSETVSFGTASIGVIGPIQYDISHNLVPQNWSIKVIMVSDGKHTLGLTSITAILTPPPSLSPSPLAVTLGASTNTLILIFFLIAIVFTLYMAYQYHPLFLIISGIVVLFFSFWVFNQTLLDYLAIPFGAIGIILIGIGAFARPEPKDKGMYSGRYPR